MTDSEWIVIRQVAYLHEAHLMRSILSGHGIEAIVSDNHLAGMRPDLSLALGGVPVRVRAQDAEAATRLLADFVTSPTIGAPVPF